MSDKRRRRRMVGGGGEKERLEKWRPGSRGSCAYMRPWSISHPSGFLRLIFLGMEELG